MLRPCRRSLPVLLAAALAATTVAIAGAASGPPPARAAVYRASGFAAVVDGWRSWYGSYGMGDLGLAWCVDHGSRAPDPAYGYRPTELPEQAPATRRAVAWAVSRHGPGADRLTSAALMLVLHDLMGARYPGGRLDLDTIHPGRLSGFAGREAELLQRARLIKADAVLHQELEAPFTLGIDAPTVPPGAATTLVARMVDARGRPVPGVAVDATVAGAALQGPARVVTGADGVAGFPVVAVAGENRIDVAAVVPGPLEAFEPTARPAQRVVRPAHTRLAASAGFVAESPPPPRRLVLEKTGDAEPWLPVAGTRFAVDGVSGELVVGDDGRTPPVDLPAGHYTVREVAPAPGYAPVEPFPVDLTAPGAPPGAEVVVPVENRALRGGLRIAKVDAVTGAPVAGARLAVRADPAGDGTFGHHVGDHTTDGTVLELPGLLPGRVRVEEIEAPPGYRRAAPVEAVVAAGEVLDVVIADVPTASVAFRKVPAADVTDGVRPDFTGARFDVRPEAQGDGPPVGSCTTGADGRCALAADALDGGGRYCWVEAVAPSGWLAASGGCFTTGAAGSVTEVEVVEHRVPPPAPPTSVAPPAPPPATPVVLAAPPAAARAPAPPMAPPPSAAPPARPALPVTGPPPVAGLAAAGTGLLAAGLALVAAFGAGFSPAASSWGRPGRRRPRRQP